MSKHAKKSRILSTVAAIGVIAALTMGGAGAALAAPGDPSPDSGPVAGGTSVTLPVPGDYAAIASGYAHTVAIGDDGNTYAWGQNNLGQLGIGSNENQTLSVRVHTPAGAPEVNFTQISAGGYFTVAIGDDGNTYAWGENGEGQLGVGSTENQTVPVRVQAPAEAPEVTFTQISAGYGHSLAIGDDGNTYAWGQNNLGQLGIGSTGNQTVPVRVQAPAGAPEVTFTQIFAGYGHSLAIGDDGNTYAWGWNSSGQLGIGSTGNQTVPVRVQAPAGAPEVTFTQVAAGTGHTVAIGDDGNTYAWGSNNSGQLGIGSTGNQTVPVRVQAPADALEVNFTQISAGGYFTVAIGDDGNTYAWGSNSSGQLGIGWLGGSRDEPFRVQTPADDPELTFTQISAGDFYTVAIGDDGNTYAWGWNGHGQLGIGSTENQLVPVRVQIPETAVTGVSFGGVPGTGVTTNADGTISVTTPESENSGPVDVTIEWTLGGVEQDPIVHEDGFTYLDPTIVISEDPGELSATAGEPYVFPAQVLPYPGADPYDPQPEITYASEDCDIVDESIFEIAGECTIEVSATVEGVEISDSFTITVEPAALDALTLGAEAESVDEGGTLDFTVAGTDAYGNSVDASGAVLTSSVETDVIDGWSVSFPTASPHTITATLGTVTAQVTIQVIPAPAEQPTPPELVQTGAGTGGLLAVGVAALLLAAGAGMLVRKARAQD